MCEGDTHGLKTSFLRAYILMYNLVSICRVQCSQRTSFELRSIYRAKNKLFENADHYLFLTDTNEKLILFSEKIMATCA